MVDDNIARIDNIPSLVDEDDWQTTSYFYTVGDLTDSYVLNNAEPVDYFGLWEPTNADSRYD